jgi:hypothetical protein
MYSLAGAFLQQCQTVNTLDPILAIGEADNNIVDKDQTHINQY